MKILVTGGTGLVGRALQEVCGNDGNEWCFLGRKECDLRELEQVRQKFDNFKPNLVVHLAANVGGLYKNMAKKVDMLEENLLINLNVLKTANAFNVNRLVCLCSTCVFPDKTSIPITESNLNEGPPHFSNEGYAYAKRILELHCRLYNESHNREYICLIPTNIYGKFDNFNLIDGHVLPSLIHKCHIAKQAKTPFVVMGSGKPLRQFLYSFDLAKIIKSYLFLNDLKGFPLSVICCPDAADEITIEFAARLISNCFGYDNIIFDNRMPDGQFRKTCSNGLLRRYLPEVSFTSFEEGVRNTVSWFVTNFDAARK